MSKRVIMLLSNGFDPDPRVHNEAVALLDRGYSVRLICWNRDRGLAKPKRETLNGLEIHRIGPKSRHNLGAPQALFILLFWLGAFLRLLFRHVDVIHCHDFDTLPPGSILAYLKRCRLVYDSHENFSRMIQYDVSTAIGKAIEYIERLLVKHVDLTLTVGEILADELVERGAKNVHVVGNWKNPDDFVFSHEELQRTRKELRIDGKGSLIVSYITTLKAERKISELIEALSGQRRYVLILGGKGPMEGAIRETIRGRSNVRFLGFVNPIDVPRYTALSDVVFYGFEPSNENSRYSAPNKLFEALAAGKVILSCDIGEIGRIINKYRCGLILEEYTPFAIRKALNYLYEHADQLDEMKQNASLLGKNRYNWNAAKSTLYGSYENLFGSPGNQREID